MILLDESSADIDPCDRGIFILKGKDNKRWKNRKYIVRQKTAGREWLGVIFIFRKKLNRQTKKF
ncbi:hypothetical protein ABF215_09830 [Fusobacterium sp. THCT13E1]|uniref:hypothetical protein n=1 Tax=Fusobacterium ulcerans TaxID=861 RepID=UPI001E409869|nr:hypothetical protein [Fusobacterium ulcerans]